MTYIRKTVRLGATLEPILEKEFRNATVEIYGTGKGSIQKSIETSLKIYLGYKKKLSELSYLTGLNGKLNELGKKVISTPDLLVPETFPENFKDRLIKKLSEKYLQDLGISSNTN